MRGAELAFQSRFYFLPGSCATLACMRTTPTSIRMSTRLRPHPIRTPSVGLARSTSEFDLFYNKGWLRNARRLEAPQRIYRGANLGRNDDSKSSLPRIFLTPACPTDFGSNGACACRGTT